MEPSALEADAMAAARADSLTWRPALLAFLGATVRATQRQQLPHANSDGDAAED